MASTKKRTVKVRRTTARGTAKRTRGAKKMRTASPMKRPATSPRRAARKRTTTTTRPVTRSRAAAPKRASSGAPKKQPGMLDRATRTLRRAADTAMGVTKTAIDRVRP